MQVLVQKYSLEKVKICWRGSRSNQTLRDLAVKKGKWFLSRWIVFRERAIPVILMKYHSSRFLNKLINYDMPQNQNPLRIRFSSIILLSYSKSLCSCSYSSRLIMSNCLSTTLLLRSSLCLAPQHHKTPQNMT